MKKRLLYPQKQSFREATEIVSYVPSPRGICLHPRHGVRTLRTGSFYEDPRYVTYARCAEFRYVTDTQPIRPIRTLQIVQNGLISTVSGQSALRPYTADT